MPAVTIIIPTYNWSTVLPFAITSILGQTFEDFELLVIGDCCTDDSAEVVARFTDPRVNWINLPQNTGHQTGPNNEGIRRASSPRIAYLGQDDLWMPHHLGLLMGAMDEGFDLVHSIVGNVRADTGLVETAPRDRDHASPGAVMPLGMLHSREIALSLGGWKDYRLLVDTPETELVGLFIASGARLKFLERLTAIKFPASWRKDAYKERRCDEQAAWLERIQNEPDLEQKVLADLAMRPRVMSPGEQAWIQAGAMKYRLLHPLEKPKRGRWIDAARDYKGLPPNPRL